MRAGDWEGAFDEARAAEEAAAARHEERAALLRARLETGLRKVRSLLCCVDRPPYLKTVA